MKENKTYTICPDENVLAQFVEGTLNEKDEDLVLLHLDNCPMCYNVVRATLESELEESMPISEQSNPLKKLDVIPNYYAAGENDNDEEINCIENKQSDRNTTCAIKVQQLVLKDLNLDISEEQILQEALQEGWYVEGKGMLMEHVGKTLNKHGIKTERMVSAGLLDIQQALHAGSKVIVAVDSSELWCNSPEEKEREKQKDLIEEIPDHVVLIEDVQAEDKTFVGVTVKDPILFEGIKSIAVDVFMDAWQDSDFFMIKTIR